MKVKRLEKMQLKKETISLINQRITAHLKGGTRNGSDTDFGNTGQATHCADVICY
ncbi:hypothetical protein C8N46_101585 [Kordia periserrulae]|uniref:Uncharacterized protein n=1 Tax=Kordia periserrulae TaxID=701523 RepID=A0A2T6C6R8_9FLAO|nr:hypothetical protein [Kordia periserrulae]PTX63975.1 hypothetical protein C8N46_101585 [Kordia periserrulae]